MDIPFSGKYDQDTYFKAVKLAYQPTSRELLMRAGIFVLAIILYFGFLRPVIQPKAAEAWDLGPFFLDGALLLILAYGLFASYLNVLLSARRRWRKDPLVKSTIKGRITARGIVAAAGGEPIHWEKFIRMRVEPELIVLLTRYGAFQALTPGFFQSEADWNEAKSEIAKRIKKGKYKVER